MNKVYDQVMSNGRPDRAKKKAENFSQILRRIHPRLTRTLYPSVDSVRQLQELVTGG